MSDQNERRALARLTDAQLLTLIDEARGELVVTTGGGYHLMVLQPAPNDAMPNPALIDEVNARRRRFFAYAQANTVRLRALGHDPELPRRDGHAGQPET